MGQVPSPTPMMVTFGDSISVTEKPAFIRPLMTRCNDARGEPPRRATPDDDDGLDLLSHVSDLTLAIEHAVPLSQKKNGAAKS